MTLQPGRTYIAKDGREIDRKLYLQNAVGEPSERLVVMTLSYGGMRHGEDEPFCYETRIYETDETQQPIQFTRIVERYGAAKEAFDGHNRWCQMLDEPRTAALADDDGAP